MTQCCTTQAQNKAREDHCDNKGHHIDSLFTLPPVATGWCPLPGAACKTGYVTCRFRNQAAWINAM